MKFEDQVKRIKNTLDEDVTAPAANPSNMSGNPQQAPVNPSQVQGQPQQQQQQQQGQQQEVTADQMMQFALNSDPNKLRELNIDANLQGDQLFQAVHDAFVAGQQPQQGQPNAQVNPAAPSNNTQTTSAQPASTNTAGQQGAMSTGV